MSRKIPTNSFRPISATDRREPRRRFFSRVSDGLVGTALARLLQRDLAATDADSTVHTPSIPSVEPRTAHSKSGATAVIQLFMTGGPSQVDLFDPKPALEKHAGDLPRAFLDNVESVGAAGGLLPSAFHFGHRGASDVQISDALPHLAKFADDIAVIRSMWTTSFNHEPAVFFMHSGRSLTHAPTIGSWVVYALGSENRDLPAYVALDDPGKAILLGTQNWQSGWLPPVYQGTRLRSTGTPILNLNANEEFPTRVVRASRTLLQQLAGAHRDSRPGQPDLEARIASYELAARMQISATDALDLSQESDRTREMYGLSNQVTESYGRRCLMARRLDERGVRMVQIYMNATSGNNPWDHHGDIVNSLKRSCAQTDQPVAALLEDLKQRGLLDSTLVVWGGEFGRLPISQGGKRPGRDHGANGFSVWLAGGGIKGGTVYGSTDDFGYHAVENRVSVHDFHATILHALGLNHEKLVYNHHGLDERLTGVEPARVVHDVFA